MRTPEDAPSPLEMLPDAVLEDLLHHIAHVDHASLLQLARASPVLYAFAVTIAVRTAPLKWYPLELPRTRRNPSVANLWSHAIKGNIVGHLGYARAGPTLDIYLIWSKLDNDPNHRELWTRFSVLGPIPPKKLRSLRINTLTMPLMAPVLPRAHRVQVDLQELELAGSILACLDTLGGFPDRVAHLAVDLGFVDFDVVGATVGKAIIRRLARLLASSRVKSLCISLVNAPNDSDFDAQVVDAVETLLVHGMPPTVEMLSIKGFNFSLDGEIPNHQHLIRVPWGRALRHIKSELALETLELFDMPVDAGPARDHLLTCVQPTLTSFGLMMANSEDMLGAVHAVIKTLASTCPALRWLQLELPDMDDTLPLGMIATFTIPLFHKLPLDHVGLVNFGLVASAESETETLFAALAKHVPGLQSLNLTRNQGIDSAVVETLLAMLPQLRWLAVWYTGAKDADRDRLLHLFPKVKVLTSPDALS
ncbi:hypothetical protein AMAG_16777 [Allomyces macrogynus ATCC 38327]|uniref:Uncharacterized protein n=1 Tax=Allomyces macrogynus (strain ATCC 38327) TaxID=578462 RepID=A0A0L0TBV0_ALLM3|nr:hypothetical protein AMAG_16777 [Allomyces macrogynus ATCC 38327]|eukprot:KNE72288.1 hypothetical protein AMAG_16777 [Allomyces macrogynus ATCC 38327]